MNRRWRPDQLRPDAMVDLPRGRKMLAAEDKAAAAGVGRKTGSASRQPERRSSP
jgi:general stress protein YciG